MGDKIEWAAVGNPKVWDMDGVLQELTFDEFRKLKYGRRLVEEVAAKEREACAKIADREAKWSTEPAERSACENIAEAIRDRTS